jgi:hypothetical protein
MSVPVAAPLFQREFDQRLPKIDARIVDQDVDAVKGSHHIVFEFADLLLLRDIGLKDLRLTAHILHRLFHLVQLLDVARSERNARARTAQRQGHCLT